MFKPLAAGALAGLLVLSTAAMAAGNQGALAPGKAANVKQAQWTLVNGHWVWLVGGAFIVAGAALAASGGSNGSLSATTTCPVSGCTPPTPTPTTTTKSSSTTTTH